MLLKQLPWRPCKGCCCVQTRASTGVLCNNNKQLIITNTIVAMQIVTLSYPRGMVTQTTLDQGRTKPAKRRKLLGPLEAVRNPNVFSFKEKCLSKVFIPLALF
ncbi:hypothetical protein CHARACLAT_019710 [Characodon lateralis]|uniref:Uncharacterized protein n=1 Tax=Characodon lateralis TaxID=208331 RepID=A0ABU7EEC6_9TELE|nr:hypothetical protein [Characodon lateralis]